MISSNLFRCGLALLSSFAFAAACGGKVSPNPDSGGSSGSGGADAGASGSGGTAGSGGNTCQPLPGCSSNAICNDGCNTCSCSNGQWACTERACIDSGIPTCEDPNRHYVSHSPALCQVLDFRTCQQGTTPFSDACGCGCKDSTDTCGCVSTAISWGPNGGFVASQDVSSLSPCRSFHHERTNYRSDLHNLSCTEELACSASAIGPENISKLLAASDVQAALKAAPITYGVDSRPVDGTVFRITVAGKSIDVGSPCSGTQGCVAVPAGVEALRLALVAIEKQGLSQAPCSQTFAQ